MTLKSAVSRSRPPVPYGANLYLTCFAFLLPAPPVDNDGCLGEDYQHLCVVLCMTVVYTMITELQRVQVLKVLTDGLSVSQHVLIVITSCAQTLYARRALLAHGLRESVLQTIYRAVNVRQARTLLTVDDLK